MNIYVSNICIIIGVGYDNRVVVRVYISNRRCIGISVLVVYKGCGIIIYISGDCFVYIIWVKYWGGC